MSILRSILSVILLINLTAANTLARNIQVSEKNYLSPIQSDPIDYRLPKNVVPTDYNITLVPNIGNFTFAGESHIHITVGIAPVTKIILHAKNLEFDKKFTSLVHGNNTFWPMAHNIDNRTDLLELVFKSKILPNNYTLHLKYTGVLNEDSNGFYITWYTNEQKKKVWLAATNFKPTQARRAFPCFDEPSMKAKFSISIKHFDNYTAVSNMPSIVSMPEDENDTSILWTKFQVTPLMSTYQIAFVISDLKQLASTNETFNIWGKNDFLNMSKYAFDIGKAELKQLEDLTGFKQVIPIMNIFGIPQLSTNAIEGWGIVTFRESALFIDMNNSSTIGKQTIATLMSRKLANQWFGNLVGPSWWDYTWLSEGFANYFQYYITDKVEPTWRLMEQFAIKNMQETAFVVDDDEKQHAMNVKVNNTREIAANFDSISQNKAGCVIRMISHALGDEVFKSGLKRYLEDKQSSVATSTDLFNELINVAEHIPEYISLKNVLDLWANQSGYPVITVERDYTNGSLTLFQNRYLSEKNSDIQFLEQWWIPVNYATQENPNFTDTLPSFWMEPTERPKRDLKNLHAKQWVIFNKKQTGYYRVNYDERNWQLISDYLQTENYTKIDVLNRAQLLDDSFNLVKTGDLGSYGVFLNLSSYLKEEIDYVPWYAAFRAFAVLDKALGMDSYNLLKLYMLKLVAKLEKTVGYFETPEDDHLTKLNRINLIKWACKAGSELCQNVTHERLVQHVDGTSKIGVDHLSVVLCAGIRTANATTWNKTFNIYETSEDLIERSVILEALGCSLDDDILKSYLAKTLETKVKIPRKDVIKAVYEGSDSGINVAFNFITDNYKAAANGNNETFLSCLYDIGSRIITPAQVDKMEKFIDSLSINEKDLADALRANALVSAKRNIKWEEKHGPTILSFLQNQDSGTTKTPSPITPFTAASSTATSSTTSSSPTTSSTTSSSPTTPSTATSSTTSSSPTTPSTPTSSTTSSSPTTPSTPTSSTTSFSPTTPSTPTSSTTSPSPTTSSTPTSCTTSSSPTTPSTTTTSTTSSSPTTPSTPTSSSTSSSPTTPSTPTSSTTSSSPTTPSTPTSSTTTPSAPTSSTTTPSTPTSSTTTPSAPTSSTTTPSTPTSSTTSSSPVTSSTATSSTTTPSTTTSSGNSSPNLSNHNILFATLSVIVARFISATL